MNIILCSIKTWHDPQHSAYELSNLKLQNEATSPILKRFEPKISECKLYLWSTLRHKLVKCFFKNTKKINKFEIRVIELIGNLNNMNKKNKQKIN